ncbi:hypothetical protein N7468_002591 [Penicillium chermesinum]|uniref:Calcineurin-like phosphoesterase domain-containing protein n=1 Tax=Penicillium chermesinum TaxID=63820 RepID=A0A9W9PIU0_9EURO|nr:uncharacterized protein N7468_002591 [Penicillium chermesinum]KAJ5247608.1 hypothetical protein N7468_002591 [Penicillium chermesinum]
MAGSAKLPDNIFPVKNFISDLPSDLIVPKSSEHAFPRRRLVIVGDVHGMRKSLEALLEEVKFDKANGDHLILVGDLINKGPDSPGVVDLAMKLGASAVRGNHDNAVLDASAELKDESRRQAILDALSAHGHAQPEAGTVDSKNDAVSAENSRSTTEPQMRHGLNCYRTALELSGTHLEWLANLPLILRLKLPLHISPFLGDTLVVVHAGLVPGLPLEAQDAHTVMHMRSFTRSPEDGNALVASEEFGEEGWATQWDRAGISNHGGFCHDAKRRLQLNKHAIGLDSGCLYGNRLSALVIEFGEATVNHHVTQVECADDPIAPKVATG